MASATHHLQQPVQNAGCSLISTCCDHLPPAARRRDHGRALTVRPTAAGAREDGAGERTHPRCWGWEGGGAEGQRGK